MNEKFTTQKNRQKTVRVLIQLLIIFGIAFFVVNSLLTVTAYEPIAPTKARINGDKGFVALSYFGVDRTGNQSLIGSGRLREHLQALKDLGYVTVTQADIQNYYHKKQNLPEKSLMLIFEDGRRDTAIFAQKILEDMNFKATMLTYPEKFALKDTKFLLPDELRELEKTTFWELGTNGYRLAFINVFDRHGNYLGELSPLQHTAVAPYLGRRYNHYLMDFIRDEDGVPLESQSKMRERISYDYETLRDIYTKAVGAVPPVHVLMHANTGSFGNNDKVSAVNDYWIRSLFKMNFNREGFSFNQRNSSIYDLTRMQPQAYWHTNHLLMRIKYDIGQEIDFVKGDVGKHRAWDILKGALEIQDETLILTSVARERGLLRLKNSSDYEDLRLSVNLKGNKVGQQKIYLRADDRLSQYVSVAIQDNVLTVREKSNGAEKELFRLNLDRHDGRKVISVAEDKKEAEIRALETFAKYTDTSAKAKIYAERLKDKRLEQVRTVADGSPPYEPELSIHARGNRTLSVSLRGGKITVEVDSKSAVADLSVSHVKPGSVYLESAWSGFGWSQRNLADDVYDGVFERLVVTENTGANNEKILFDGRLRGLEAIKHNTQRMFGRIVDWFITNL